MMSSKPMVVVKASSFLWSSCDAMRSHASMRRSRRRHDRIDAEQRHAAQDERHDGRRQVEALRQSAGGDRAVVLRLRQQVGQRVRADAVDAGGPAFLGERLAGFGEFGAVDDFRGTQVLQETGLGQAAGRGDDVPAELRQQR